MPKTIKTGPSQKKESSAEKRRRRENIAKARSQARLFVLPLLVLGFLLLAGWMWMRFGTGRRLTGEERERVRGQREMARMLRQYGGDYEKLQELLKMRSGAGTGAGESAEPVVPVEPVDEAVVEPVVEEVVADE